MSADSSIDLLHSGVHTASNDGHFSNTSPDRSHNDVNDTHAEVVERIVKAEWQQFQCTENEGGRANCQGNWPMFHQMRASQFLAWQTPVANAYLGDLEQAERHGRNLVTEKYARMMASTAPEEYATHIEPFIPALSQSRIEQQERIIAQQVAWARDFRERYPRLGLAMRLLTTSEDTREETSFETYLRGELGTYSQFTLDLYEQMVREYKQQSINITELIVTHTVHLAGFATLEEAERAQGNE